MFKKTKNIIFVLVVFAFVFVIIFLISGYHSAMKPVTYLPDVPENVFNTQIPELNKTELKTPWYILNVDENGRINVKSVKNELILSGLTYYSSYEGTNENFGLDNVSVELKNDSTISIKGNNASDVNVEISLAIHKSSSKIDIHVKTNYNSDVTVKREAFIAKFDVPLNRVFLKNRKTDVAPFDQEYWLQRQGALFGKDTISCLVYHTPEISSLQLKPEKNLLFVNLDYALDHPYVHIPYQEDAGERWLDLSASRFSKGDIRENHFSFYFGSTPPKIPRFMLSPNGYVAGYVFTEHADGGSINTHQAAYFGAEDISFIDSAVGGFAYHKIPVSKSVFYANTKKKSTGSSIRDDFKSAQFVNFLEQIYKTGLYDICLHTPEDLTSDRATLEESIQFMKEKFNASTWIDHGMYSGKINRECFVCDGLTQGSEYYAADLWENHGTRYFWSPAVEMIWNNSHISFSKGIKKLKFFQTYVDFLKRYFSPEELKELKSGAFISESITRFSNKGELNSLMPNRGHYYPTPVYWKHESRTKNFYSWSTEYAKAYDNLSAGNPEKYLSKEIKQIEELIKNQGIFINHGYFVRNIQGKDVLTYSNDKLVINPYFDRILEFMSDEHDKGNLWLTTIKELLDYWVLLDNLTIEYMPNGMVYVNNLNDVTIYGLSMVVDADSIRINGNIPNHKKVGEDTVFWFDLPANAQIQIETD